jgi:hypothetical protein
MIHKWPFDEVTVAVVAMTVPRVKLRQGQRDGERESRIALTRGAEHHVKITASNKRHVGDVSQSQDVLGLLIGV